METNTRKRLWLAALMAWFGLMIAARAPGQTFTTLHSFAAIPSQSPYTNSEGGSPSAPLIFSDNTLYGAAAGGGSSGNGTLFAVNTDGTGFTNLYTFAGSGDGASPGKVLILSGNSLYGAAWFDGDSSGFQQGNGTLFKVNRDGTGFTTLYSFTGGSDGSGPSSLMLAGNTLYGTAAYAGCPVQGTFQNLGCGTVFKLNTDGTGFTILHTFTPTSGWPSNTNSDGGNPFSGAGLILSGDTLYGTANFGGSSGNGTIFKVDTNGSNFTVLYTFTDYAGETNSDGANPRGLVLSGSTFYGTAAYGGVGNNGTVFAVNTDGSGFRTLHSFSFAPGSGPFGGTNGDGGGPLGGLILSGNTLYGTAVWGGSSTDGTVFAVNTDGTGFTVLHNFTAPTGTNNFNWATNVDGIRPQCGLMLLGNTLYGTASGGGSAGSGTVFSLTLPFQLSITQSGNNVILTWPTNAAGLVLQSAQSLVPPVGWNGISANPTVVNGLNIVTNPMSGDQQFYKLTQPSFGN